MMVCLMLDCFWENLSVRDISTDLKRRERVMDACSYWTGRRDVKREEREVVTWAIDSGEFDAMYKGEAV